MKKGYIESTHRLGRITTTIAMLLMISVPTIITIVNLKSVHVEWAKTVSGIISLSLVFLPLGLAEVISYAPVLGVGGSYLAFITGNVMGMKLPAATNALTGADIEHGTEEAEVISTLAIGASTLVTTLVIFLGMIFLGTLLQPIFQNEAYKVAFDNMMPALFGAMAVPIFVKSFKLAWIPVIIACGLYIILGQVTMARISNNLMLPFILIILGIYFILYKVGVIKEQTK